VVVRLLKLKVTRHGTGDLGRSLSTPNITMKIKWTYPCYLPATFLYPTAIPKIFRHHSEPLSFGIIVFRNDHLCLLYMDQHQEPGELLSRLTVHSAKDLISRLQHTYHPNVRLTHLICYQHDMLPTSLDKQRAEPSFSPDQVPMWRPLSEVIPEIQDQMASE
jgi:hypothetical protein